MTKALKFPTSDPTQRQVQREEEDKALTVPPKLAILDPYQEPRAETTPKKTFMKRFIPQSLIPLSMELQLQMQVTSKERGLALLAAQCKDNSKEVPIATTISSLHKMVWGLSNSITLIINTRTSPEMVDTINKSITTTHTRTQNINIPNINRVSVANLNSMNKIIISSSTHITKAKRAVTIVLIPPIILASSLQLKFLQTVLPI
mmetsp:Transcript_1606/g.1432  ORF Transcript_1606/g.1432 Transcript_1606/m.1432 type:complete len:204 (-) Transcript_1606:1129-1740(-)